MSLISFSVGIFLCPLFSTLNLYVTKNRQHNDFSYLEVSRFSLHSYESCDLMSRNSKTKFNVNLTGFYKIHPKYNLYVLDNKNT